MTHQSASMVMDISPWPNGKGFEGSQEWWLYVNSKDERRRIDHMLGSALLSESVCHRLIEERDENLLTAFGLSDATKRWIRSIEAESISELASAIVQSYKQSA